MARLKEGKEKETNQSKFRSSPHLEFVLSSCTVSLSKAAITHNLYDWQVLGRGGKRCNQRAIRY
jgi:hypothetical protein